MCKGELSGLKNNRCSQSVDKNLYEIERVGELQVPKSNK